jgi:hypothetical protein
VIGTVEAVTGNVTVAVTAVTPQAVTIALDLTGTVQDHRGRWSRAESPGLWAGARSPLWRRCGTGSGSASGGPGSAVEGASPGHGPG